MGGSCCSNNSSKLNEKNCEEDVKLKSINNIILFLIGKGTMEKKLENYEKNLDIEKFFSDFEKIPSEKFEKLDIVIKMMSSFLENAENNFNRVNIQTEGIFECSNLYQKTKKVVAEYYYKKLRLDYVDLNTLDSNSEAILLFEDKIEKHEFINEDYDYEAKLNFVFEMLDYENIKDLPIIKQYLYFPRKNTLNKHFVYLINKYIYYLTLFKGEYLLDTDSNFIKLSKYLRKELKLKLKGSNQARKEITQDGFKLLKTNKNNLTFVEAQNSVIQSNKDTNTFPRKSDLYYSNENQENDLRTKSSSLNFSKKNLFFDRHLSTDKLKNNNSNSNVNQQLNLEKKAKLKLYESEFYQGGYDILHYCFCGNGFLLKPQRSLYQGTYLNGKKDGYGYIFKFSGENQNYYYYIGEWKDGKEHGYGQLYSAPKLNKFNMTCHYKRGYFSNGQFIKGTFCQIKELVNKQILVETYIGKLKNNEYINGYKIERVKYILINGNFEEDYSYFYQGEFRNNIENGFGISVKSFTKLKYQQIYRGEFDHGLMHGEGKIIFEGNYYIRKYEGIFEEDKYFCGYGKVYFTSGDYYEGFFDKSHAKCMVGQYIHANSRNKPDFNFIHQTSSSNLIWNKFKKISFEEFDKLDKDKSTNFIGEGDYFFGEYLFDFKHGIGKYYFHNQNIILLGEYIDGLRNGRFESFKVKNYDLEEEMDILNTSADNLNTKSLLVKKGQKSKKRKLFYLFENDEVIDSSEKPFLNK